jgi:flagellar biosynthesis protein FlhF
MEVRMITIDNYRIAGKEQLEKYGHVLNIPVQSVESSEDLRQVLALYPREVDVILIDTMGRSPRDSAKLAEMKQVLDVCGSQAEIHLAVMASTKAADINRICQQFEPFGYRSVIITKLDETTQIGNVVSALSERNKAISFITNGQKVPNDIEEGTRIRLLLNLEGFTINRNWLEKRFPPGESKFVGWK